MRPRIKTISSIGNNQRAFTFIEVMVTLVVLSAGIVMVYKSFFLCLDYLTRLSSRIHANALIDQKMAEVQIYVGQHKDTGFARGPDMVTADIQGRPLTFAVLTQVKGTSMEGLLRMTVEVAWQEHNHPVQISREGMLSL